MDCVASMSAEPVTPAARVACAGWATGGPWGATASSSSSSGRRGALTQRSPPALPPQQLPSSSRGPACRRRMRMTWRLGAAMGCFIMRPPSLGRLKGAIQMVQRICLALETAWHRAGASEQSWRSTWHLSCLLRFPGVQIIPALRSACGGHCSWILCLHDRRAACAVLLWTRVQRIWVYVGYMRLSIDHIFQQNLWCLQQAFSSRGLKL